VISYKQHLFVSLIESMPINESFSSPERVSFIDLLLEAPLDDDTANKMIADKKRVSIYYQGDEKSKKGWYSIEAVKVKDKGGNKFLLAYDVPKDGGKPELKYFIQDKIVNWNVLGKKDAESAKKYDEKLFKFFVDPKVPVAQKSKFKEKLDKLGIGSKIKKLAIGASLIGSLLGGFQLNNFVDNNVHAKAFKEFATLRKSDFTQKDLKKDERDALKVMIEKALSNPKKYTRKGSTNFYEVANDLNKETAQKDRLNFGDKEKFGLDQTKVKSLYTKLSLLLGNARISETEEGYTVTDKYDFNQYYDNPENYKLSNFPKKSMEIVKYFGSGNLIKGFEEIGNYYEALGYNGYKVNIQIPK
jgi:hypothetical protein